MWERIKFYAGFLIGFLLVFGFTFYLGLQVFFGDSFTSGGFRRFGWVVDLFGGLIDMFGHQIVGVGVMVLSVVGFLLLVKMIIRG